MKIVTKIVILLIFIILIACCHLFLFQTPKMKTMSHLKPMSDTLLPPPPSVNYIDDVLDKMELGNIVFNSPSKMDFDERKMVQLILSPDKTFKELTESFNEEEEILGSTIKITDKMEANLVGSGFQITNITPTQQAVSSTVKTEWKWEVKPLEYGKQNLYLTINAIINIDNNPSLRSLQTFSKTIEVDIKCTKRIYEFFKSNWQWLWTTILLPAAIWFWRIRKSNKKKPTNIDNKPRKKKNILRKIKNTLMFNSSNNDEDIV